VCSAAGGTVATNLSQIGGGGSDGVAVAIPVEMVKRVADSILKEGRMRYGYIGVLLAQAPEGTRDAGGAVIAEVIAASPADRAGLEPGDVITRIDGEPIADRASLMRTVGAREPGTVVRIEAVRGGEPFTTNLKLVTRPRQGAGMRDERDALVLPAP